MGNAAPEAIRAALEKVLASARFTNAQRRSALLRFLVEQALSGETESLKEYTVGVQVYHRNASTYDPRVDPVVRVDIGRLRNVLDQYYQTDGRADPVRITIPKGVYVPVFESRNRGCRWGLRSLLRPPWHEPAGGSFLLHC